MKVHHIIYGVIGCSSAMSICVFFELFQPVIKMRAGFSYFSSRIRSALQLEFRDRFSGIDSRKFP